MFEPVGVTMKNKVAHLNRYTTTLYRGDGCPKRIICTCAVLRSYFQLNKNSTNTFARGYGMQILRLIVFIKIAD